MVRRSQEHLARGFPATRHSALAAVRSGDQEQRRRGLAVLAEAYWGPVHGYLRLRWGKSHEEAKDLAQELFAQLLHRDLLSSFDPQRARLRTFLRLCIDGLVTREHRAARRLKRGGGEAAVSFDAEQARADFEGTADAAESPEALFDKEWARGLFAAALRRLEERCRRERKTQHFELFQRYELDAGPERPTYAELARRFRIATTDVTNRLAWVRRELRRTVLELLRASTASESEFRDEARSLLGVERP